MWALSIRPKFQLHFQKFPVVNGSSCSGTSAKADNLVRYMYAKIFGNFFQWITAPFDFPPRILSWMAPFLYSRVSIFSRNFFSGNLCTIFPHIEIFRIHVPTAILYVIISGVQKWDLKRVICEIVWLLFIYSTFSNSLEIHQVKTKKITTVREVWIPGLN